MNILRFVLRLPLRIVVRLPAPCAGIGALFMTDEEEKEEENEKAFTRGRCDRASPIHAKTATSAEGDESPMTTPETLRAAAAAIRRDGWTQFERHDRRGRVCALGAIERAFGYRDCLHHDAEVLAPKALRALCDAIGQPRPQWLVADAIGDWNNADGQTAENVAQAFELAAVLVEAAQSTEQPASTNAVDPSAQHRESGSTRDKVRA